MLNVITTSVHELYKKRHISPMDYPRELYEIMADVDVLHNVHVKRTLKEVYNAEPIDAFRVTTGECTYTLPCVSPSTQIGILLTYKLMNGTDCCVRSHAVQDSVLNWLACNATSTLILTEDPCNHYYFDVNVPVILDGICMNPDNIENYLHIRRYELLGVTKERIDDAMYVPSSNNFKYINKCAVTDINSLPESDVDYMSRELLVRLHTNKLILREDNKYFTFYYSVNGVLHSYSPCKYPNTQELLYYIDTNVPTMDAEGGILCVQDWLTMSKSLVAGTKCVIRKDNRIYEVFDIESVLEETKEWLKRCDWGDIRYLK